MDVRAVQAAGEMAIDACALRQGAVHPGDADLPLSRPLDVRSGEIPRQGRGAADAQRERSDREGAAAARGERFAGEDDLKEIDKEIRRIVNEAAEFAQADPEPDPAELWTDIYA